MGLDVYLYHSLGDRAKAKQQEEEFEELSSAKFTELNEADKAAGHSKISDETYAKYKAYCDEIAPQFGMVKDKYGHSHGEQVKIEQKSAKHPDHMFEIGYFRSSYNEGGINRVLSNFGIDGLYEIFDNNGKDAKYEFVPDWTTALEKAKGSIAAYKKHLGSVLGDVSITKISYNPFTPSNGLPSSEEDVLELLKTQMEKNSKGSFFNSIGTFFFDEPMQVIAVFAGTQKGFMNTLRGLPETGEPCFYMAYRTDKPEGKEDWYLEALEVVQESCEFVLSQPDPQNFYVHWSS